MFEAHRNKIAAAVVTVAALVLLTLDAGADVGAGSPGSAPRGAARATQAATGGMFATVGAWITGVGGSAAGTEEDRLRAELDRTREENARLIGVLQENARLRDLVGFKKEHPEFEVVPARVVSRDTTPYFRVASIKVEVTGAVEVKMPVVVSGGVVGQVHQVDGDYADVIMLSDPRSRIDALSQRNRAHGLVQGLGHERDYLAKVAYLSEKDAVRPGDVMVTSGMGGVFPRDLIIGSVSSVDTDERGLFQEVELRPAVDLSRVEEVFVITNAGKTLE